jgi:hypothetical protein
MMVFFRVNDISIIDILPQKLNFSTEYFRENIAKELKPIVYATKQKVQAPRICRPCAYAHVHTTQVAA